MKKILIIGANVFQSQLVERANELNYETHVFAWEKKAIAKPISDYFYPISIRKIEKILSIARKIQPDAITSIGSDLAVPTVNYIANKLGLVGNSNQSSILTTNKYEMRKILSKHNLPCPNYLIIADFDDINFDLFKYPFMVKSLDRSGSRGVFLVKNDKECMKAIKDSLNVSFTDRILIEDFIEGPQFSIEGYSYDKEHTIIGITREFYTGEPYFVETQHIFPANIKASIENQLINTTCKAVDVLKIENSAFHSEIRLTKGNEPVIIEIAGRLGGDFRTDLIKIAYNINILDIVLNISLGNNPNPLKITKNRCIAAIKWILNTKDLKLLEKINQKRSKMIYRVGKIKKIKNFEIKNSSMRYGYFLLNCNNYKECYNVLSNNF